MGNKLGRRRQVVDDKYTRPQGLYQHKDVDQKKLRKLILDSKLAPCYPGDDDCGHELEECPICFLYYPSLNRSRCCTKGICTECFLQMKTPNSSRPTQCPFCKTSNYAVEYRGVKTKEEKGMEQIEEQRVIEAKIRMRQQEILDDEERTHKQQELSSSRAVGQQEILDDEERTHKQQELSSSRAVVPNEVESNSISVPTFTSGVDGEDIVPFQDSSAASVTRQPFRHRQNRDDEFDLDLEDIMVMEAIWLSIQEKGKQKNYSAYGDAPLSEQYMMSEEGQQFAESSSSASPSPSGGLACAIAALAEHQQTNGSESSSTTNYNTCNNTTTSAAAAYFPNIREEEEEMIQNNNYPAAGSSMEALSESQIAMTRVNGNWVSEMNTTYDSSTIVRGVDDMDEEEEEEDGGGGDRNFGFTSVVDEEEETQGSFQAAGVPPSEPIVPESFEEQMMLAMAVSLAEARVRATSPSVAWQ